MDRDTPAELRLSRLHFPVDSLGPGRRAGIWVQGCSIHCEGCIARDTWDQMGGSGSVSPIAVVSWIQGLLEQGIDGITISGGEPFDQPESLRNLLELLRSTSSLVDLDVLIYSGYVFSKLRRAHSEILKLTDALMSGPFVATKPTDLPWRGSSNQRLVLLTDRAVQRFSSAERDDRLLQISADAGRLWITGIPQYGDLQRLEEILADRGIGLGEVSWRA